MLGPREDIIPWDDYFMAIATLVAMRSRDPNTQVGACLVNESNHIVGTGYNGLPRGCNPHLFPWDRVGQPLDTKYMYTCHAEENAIDNSDKSKLSGSRIYVTLFPCNNCAKRIIQNGITQVIYLSDKYNGSDENTASKRLLNSAGVIIQQFKATRDNIILSLK